MILKPSNGNVSGFHPCARKRRPTVPVKKRGKHYHYAFQLYGKRYRGSTKKAGYTEAKTFEAELIKKITEGYEPSSSRFAVPLREASERFLSFIEQTNLAHKTKVYYRNGWKLLENTRISGMLVPHITEGDVSVLRFPDGPSNTNNALRTLRRILNMCVEWGYMTKSPKIKLVAEYGREVLLDAEAEAKLISAVNPKTKRHVCSSILRDVIILIRQTGMRNVSELYQMRIENINWDERTIFNPKGKSKNARRAIPMSDRAFNLLRERCAGRDSGWVFPSKQSRSGHITNLSKQFARARDAAGLPKGLVLYCGRHDFGTYALQETGNLAAVMKSMGHADVRTAMKYQHPDLNVLRDALNARENSSEKCHKKCHIPETARQQSSVSC